MNRSPREYISSRDNPLIKTVIRLASSASARREENLYICDGPTLLPEALARGAEITAVLCAESMQLPPLPASVRLVELPERLIGAVSTTEKPQGLVFITRRPSTIWHGFRSRGIYLVLDRVQDPGNVGSILRTADAFSATGILLGPGCADPFSPKTVRASMGAVFSRFFYEFKAQDQEDGLLKALDSCALPMIACVPDENALDLLTTDIDISDVVLLLGNEGTGLSLPLLRKSGAKLKIPMGSSCQSLGVAAAATVFLWESFKYRFILGGIACPR